TGEHRGGVIAMECSQAACDTACRVAGGSGVLSASSPADQCLSPSKPRRLGCRHSSSSGRPARRHPAASGDTEATRWPQVDTRTFQLLRTWWLLAMGILVVLAGCGYEFGSTVKPGAARDLHLAVPVFHNDTFEPILDKRVTEFVR